VPDNGIFESCGNKNPAAVSNQLSNPKEATKMKFKLSLKQIWLAVGIFSLILPVFLPSVAGADNFFVNLIGVVNIVMFILSFPCSLFGLPVVFFAWYALDMNPNSIEGAYLNTILFFVLGFVQWFWIARFWYPPESPFQNLNLAGVNSELLLPETAAIKDIPFSGADARSPVERVFREKDSA